MGNIRKQWRTLSLKAGFVHRINVIRCYLLYSNITEINTNFLRSKKQIVFFGAVVMVRWIYYWQYWYLLNNYMVEIIQYFIWWSWTLDLVLRSSICLLLLLHKLRTNSSRIFLSPLDESVVDTWGASECKRPHLKINSVNRIKVYSITILKIGK